MSPLITRSEADRNADETTTPDDIHFARLGGGGKQRPRRPEKGRCSWFQAWECNADGNRASNHRSNEPTVYAKRPDMEWIEQAFARPIIANAAEIDVRMP